MAAMIAAAIGVTHPANATQSLYEVYDLGALPSDQGVSQAYAINNSGSVVGSGPGGGGTSWIWDRRNGMRSLGALPGGDGNTRATAINESGTVVGFAEIADTGSGATSQAFVWTARNGMQPIPGLPQSSALGIGNSGAIVGGSNSVVGFGLLWKNGKVTALGFWPVYGINNRDLVVGANGQTAVLWSAGKMTDLGTLLAGSRVNEAHAISDSGRVTGVSEAEAFIWDAAQGMRGLGFIDPACLQSDGRAINNLGTIVGYGCTFTTVGQVSHAFVWDRSQGIVDLNQLVFLPAGDMLNVAYGINDQGQIVGAGMFDGAFHAFLLDPTPPAE
jgi:probable HAF family extracellular repeat protein